MSASRHGAVTFTLVSCVLAGLVSLAADAAVIVTLLSSDATEPLGGTGALVIRAVWALIRAIGLLLVARPLARGSATARGVAIVLAVSTVFNAFRLSTSGITNSAVTNVLLAAAAVMCLLVVVLLVAVPPVRAHLTSKPGEKRRFLRPAPDEPTWVLTARPLAASLLPCLTVPLLVGLAALLGGDISESFGTARAVLSVPALVVQAVLILVMSTVLGYALLGIGRVPGTRWVVAVFAIIVVATQPLICWLVLGIDGLIRDAVPAVLASVLVLYGLLIDRRAREWFASAPHRRKETPVEAS